MLTLSQRLDGDFPYIIVTFVYCAKWSAQANKSNDKAASWH